MTFNKKWVKDENHYFTTTLRKELQSRNNKSSVSGNIMELVYVLLARVNLT